MFVARRSGLVDVYTAAGNARVVDQAQPGRQVGPLEPFHRLGDPGEPALQNGWTAVGATPAGFQKSPTGDVFLYGWFSNPGATAGLRAMFVLPATHRPPYNVNQGMQRGYDNGAGTYLRPLVTIAFTGEVYVDAAGNIDTSVAGGAFLSGHRFRAAELP